MTVQPKHITVCLCALNADKFIGQAIESVLSQSYKNFHLYVVNDASTDETLAVAKRYLSDLRLTIIDLEENIGTYAGKNLVLKEFAQGEYWAHHDADDYSEPDRFEKQIAYMSDNHLDGCGTAIDEQYENGLMPRIPGGDLKMASDGNMHRINCYPESFDLKDLENSIDDLPKIKLAMNGSLLFKLNVIKELGGFDGTTYVGADTDMLWRFIKLYRFGNMQEILYHRRFHGASLTQNASTGFDSAYRLDYARKIEKRNLRAIRLLRDGNIQQAKEESTENFFYPKVKYRVFTGLV